MWYKLTQWVNIEGLAHIDVAEFAARHTVKDGRTPMMHGEAEGATEEEAKQRFLKDCAATDSLWRKPEWQGRCTAEIDAVIPEVTLMEVMTRPPLDVTPHEAWEREAILYHLPLVNEVGRVEGPLEGVNVRKVGTRLYAVWYENTPVALVKPKPDWSDGSDTQFWVLDLLGLAKVAQAAHARYLASHPEEDYRDALWVHDPQKTLPLTWVPFEEVTR